MNNAESSQSLKGSIFKGPQAMVDIETFGTAPGSAITSIGAVLFDEEGVKEDTAFYVRICPKSCVAAGMTMDPDTVVWWLKQSEEARAEMTKPGAKSIGQALMDFSQWLPLDRNTCLWGNGSDFDNVLMAAAYRIQNLDAPWKFYNNRCYRTIKALAPGVPMDRSGTHHNALDDAISQARHLVKILTGK